MADVKTNADFRKDNRKAVWLGWVEFVGVCCNIQLFSARLVEIDGSEFKAANSRDMNFTIKNVRRSLEKTQASIDRYLANVDVVDTEEPEIRAESLKKDCLDEG